MHLNSLHRNERLRSRKSIEQLFRSKQSFTLYPYRVYWSVRFAEKGSLKMAVSVSKKLFKKAVHRNLIKRRTREAYRKQKQNLLQLILREKLILQCFFVYIGTKTENYMTIEKKIALILQTLADKASEAEQ